MEKIGGVAVDLDFVPLTNAALMLYGSSFIAERAAGIAPFLRGDGEGGAKKRAHDWAAAAADDERLLPVTRQIMAAAGALSCATPALCCVDESRCRRGVWSVEHAAARSWLSEHARSRLHLPASMCSSRRAPPCACAAANYTATDVYEDLARLRALRADAFAHIKAAGADVLVVPTVMHHYLVKEREKQETEDPKKATYNAYLGTFTNFVNLLGMCACSVPAGRLPEVPLEVRLCKWAVHMKVSRCIRRAVVPLQHFLDT